MVLLFFFQKLWLTAPIKRHTGAQLYRLLKVSSRHAWQKLRGFFFIGQELLMEWTRRMYIMGGGISPHRRTPAGVNFKGKSLDQEQSEFASLARICLFPFPDSWKTQNPIPRWWFFVSWCRFFLVFVGETRWKINLNHESRLFLVDWDTLSSRTSRILKLLEAELDPRMLEGEHSMFCFREDGFCMSWGIFSFLHRLFSWMMM